MKYLAWFVTILLILLIGVYGVLFTSFGNQMLKPLIEAKINEQTELESKLSILHLDMHSFDIVLELDSDNIAYFKGEYSLFELSIDASYNFVLNKIKNLKPLRDAPIDEKFYISGTLKGAKQSLIIQGKSDLAASQSTFEALFKEYEVVSIKANIKNIELAKVLYMAKQPHYGDGIMSLDVDINDARKEHLNGKIISNIKEGVFDSEYLSKAYAFTTKMPQTSFNLDTTTLLNGDFADTKVDFDSSLAYFNIQSARVNIKESSILSDYTLKIPNLDKLYFLSNRHLRGDLSAKGELKKDTNLDLTLYSNIAGGKIDAKLHNNDLHVGLASVKTLEVLNILLYPEVFKATLNGSLNYNLASQKGSFHANLVDGIFMNNEMVSLVKQLAKVDLYKENFKGNITADIDKENILTSFALSSINASLKSKDTKLNTKTKEIESKIDIVANKNTLGVMLEGDVNAPNVTVDAEELIKSEAKKAVQKELGNVLKGLF